MAAIFCHARLLLLPALVAAGGGGEAWYTGAHEKSYVEAIILIVLVVLALLFETFWHQLTHGKQHSYKYGVFHTIASSGGGHCPHKDGRDGHGNVQHLRLERELVTRTGGEFMTLGFLAFVVFIFNQTGGFILLESSFPGSDAFHMPNSDEDWLHMAEVVHMKLFLGMVFYFFLIHGIVRGSVHRIQKWEQLCLRRLANLKRGLSPSSHLDHVDKDLAQYLLWRDYFLNRVIAWKHHRPKLFTYLCERFDIDEESDNSDLLLKNEMDDRFSFSSYLALVVEEGTRDSICVHNLTWCCVIMLFALFAMINRTTSMSLRDLTPFFIGVTVIVLGKMGYSVRSLMAAIKTYGPEVKDQDKREHWSSPRLALKSIHQRYQTEVAWLRLLQVVLFLISYVFARTVGDFDEWRVDPWTTALLSALFALLFAILSHVLPYQVPLFLAIMALPPYVDAANFETLVSVIDDHQVQKFSRSGGHPMSAAGDEEVILQMPKFHQNASKVSHEHRSPSKGGHDPSSPSQREPSGLSNLTSRMKDVVARLDAIEESNPGIDREKLQMALEAQQRIQQRLNALEKIRHDAESPGAPSTIISEKMVHPVFSGVVHPTCYGSPAASPYFDRRDLTAAPAPSSGGSSRSTWPLYPVVRYNTTHSGAWVAPA